MAKLTEEQNTACQVTLGNIIERDNEKQCTSAHKMLQEHP